MNGSLDYKGIEFPVSKKGYKIKFKRNVSINVFRHGHKHVYPFYLSKASDVCEKVFFNVMNNNNSVYGKTMENLRNGKKKLDYYLKTLIVLTVYSYHVTHTF